MLTPIGGHRFVTHARSDAAPGRVGAPTEKTDLQRTTPAQDASDDASARRQRTTLGA
jgi:hypothetical protein